jgi:hypothetical protein
MLIKTINQLMNKFTYLIALCLGGAMLFSSCKKIEGPGGTSSITGNVSGLTLSSSGGNAAEQEVTTIICTHADGIGGSILDNSDYFLLNTPNGGTNYYVWYENTNWLGQDPNLSGRTGIKITYSNSESNVTIAINTEAAISAAASGDYTVSILNDMLTITNVAFGEVADADDMNTPFSVDILNQGKSALSGTSSSVEGPMVDERVYIIYGEEDFYSESIRTDANGDFQFKGLTPGDYRIYAFSVDTLSPVFAEMQVEVSATISDKKEVVSAPSMYLVKD